MITTFIEFRHAATEKLDAFNNFINAHQLAQTIQPDHFGYRCLNSDEFARMRALFEFESTFIYQSIIAGRRIALIKLKKPFITLAGPLSYVELSDQKPDGSQKSGFDHVEFFSNQKSVAELVSLFAEKGLSFSKIERPHHVTFDHQLENGLILRIEPIALIQKIIEQEVA